MDHEPNAVHVEGTFQRPRGPSIVIVAFLAGILVALVKIAELATVTPGIGMYAVGLLVILLPAIMVNVDPGEVWRRVEWADGAARAASAR